MKTGGEKRTRYFIGEDGECGRQLVDEAELAEYVRLAHVAYDDARPIVGLLLHSTAACGRTLISRICCEI